jgi:hypothetical protein
MLTHITEGLHVWCTVSSPAVMYGLLDVAQGSAGCQQMQWRNEPGGYLREILTAKVYDVAVRMHEHKIQTSPLHYMHAGQL